MINIFISMSYLTGKRCQRPLVSETSGVSDHWCQRPLVSETIVVTHHWYQWYQIQLVSVTTGAGTSVIKQHCSQRPQLLRATRVRDQSRQTAAVVITSL